MIKYSITIHLNKEIKAKVNHYFPLEFTEFIWKFIELTEGEKQGHVTKLLGQFWVSSHLPTYDTAYILDKVFIWASGPSWTLY